MFMVVDSSKKSLREVVITIGVTKAESTAYLEHGFEVVEITEATRIKIQRALADESELMETLKTGLSRKARGTK